MKNSIQTFNFYSDPIRTQIVGEKLYLNLNDICKALNYSNPREALRKYIHPEDVTKRDTLTKGGRQKVSYVNESGLYALIFGSKLPKAREFTHWVTSEVLPQIRKTGVFLQPHNPNKAIPLVSHQELENSDELTFDLSFINSCNCLIQMLFRQEDPKVDHTASLLNFFIEILSLPRPQQKRAAKIYLEILKKHYEDFVKAVEDVKKLKMVVEQQENAKEKTKLEIMAICTREQ